MLSRRTTLELLLVTGAVTAFTFAYAFIAYLVLKDEFPPTYWDIWYRWDAQPYLYIARIGYMMGGPQRTNIAFFPVYPLAVRACGYVVANPILATLVVSNLAYVLASFYLYRLARLDHSPAVARGAVLALSAFPTAYFLHAGYSESLFLLLAIASFYYARTGAWLRCGLTGMLAAGTRIVGVLLLPALIVEYLAQRQWRLRDVRWSACWLLLISLGLAFYLYINYLAFGNPLAFLQVQREHWSQRLAPPWRGMAGAWNSMSWQSPSMRVMQGGANVAAGGLGYGLAGYALVAMRPSYGVYMLLTWLVSTSNGFWMSELRFLLVLFPMYIAMARGGRNWAGGVMLTISAMLYGLFLANFAIGRWAF